MQLVAWLAVTTKSFDRFVPIAGRLSADWWIPVDALAQAAAEAGQAELAGEVYAAAIASGGIHVDHLARRCRDLTGSDPPIGRHLCAVE